MPTHYFRLHQTTILPSLCYNSNNTVCEKKTFQRYPTKNNQFQYLFLSVMAVEQPCHVCKRRIIFYWMMNN